MFAWNKSTRLSLPSTSNLTQFPLDLIHSDVWGPAPMSSINCHSYFLLFIDDRSKYSWPYPIKYKSQASIIFPQFQAIVER